MGSKRTIITLSESNKNWLEAYSRARGISMAEAIRKGISRLRENESRALYRELAEQTRGIWEKGDGLAWQDKLRAEWDRDHD
ncbi:MAG: hypothetical protein K9K62_10515 [Desulfobacteraceae bacterium]|nr:hypothetical protein [Desulfobacteraceae bacterium]